MKAGRAALFEGRPRLTGELGRSKQTMRVAIKQKWADTPVQSRTGHSRTPPPLVLTQVKSSRRVLTSSALLKVQKLKFSQSRLVSRGVTWHVTSPLPGHVTRDTWHIAQLLCHNTTQNISNFYDKWDDVIKILPPLGFSPEVTLSSLPSVVQSA